MHFLPSTYIIYFFSCKLYILFTFIKKYDIIESSAGGGEKMIYKLFLVSLFLNVILGIEFFNNVTKDI